MSAPESFDPKPENPNVALIGANTLREAEALLLGCEGCSQDAEMPLDALLDGITGNDPAVTAYIFVEAMVQCPKCRRELHEKTLVKW